MPLYDELLRDVRRKEEGVERKGGLLSGKSYLNVDTLKKTINLLLKEKRKLMIL